MERESRRERENGELKREWMRESEREKVELKR